MTFPEEKRVNFMDEVKMPLYALMFHCGWDTKSPHTISGYIFTSLSNGMICVNTLALSLFKVYNENYWCVPPTLDNV